ncbi:MAG TPA: methyltransferase [Thermoanaerobaculia bacterium]
MQTVASLLDRLDPVAEATMRNLIGGAVRTQAIHVAAKLGIADHLSLGPRTVEELAGRVGAHAPTLRRLLRYLASSGVFVESEDGRFALNRLAEWLQTAHPRSMRPSAIRAGEGLWSVAGRLLSAVQTGSTPYEELHGRPFFERVDPEAFAARMSATTGGLGEAIAALETFAGARRVVDVGGGNGALLLRLLDARPELQGVLFDRPETIAAAREKTGGRVELEAGDFFESLPAGDVYVLSWILHDWDDEKAVRILRACAGDVVIVEVLLPARAEATAIAPGMLADPFTLDLQMLLLTGGRERTQDEYRALLERAGFEVVRVTPLDSFRGASAIEAHRLPNPVRETAP